LGKHGVWTLGYRLFQVAYGQQQQGRPDRRRMDSRERWAVSDSEKAERTHLENTIGQLLHGVNNSKMTSKKVTQKGQPLTWSLVPDRMNPMP